MPDYNVWEFVNTLGQDEFIVHPYTGGISYGSVPELKSGVLVLEGGDVFLRAGSHFKYGGGYGVRHIWQKHGHELSRFGDYRRIEDVSRYVADIMTHRTPIYSEFAPSKSGSRLTVVKSSLGAAILEPKTMPITNEVFYSVVTAYKLRQVHGVLLGHIKGMAKEQNVVVEVSSNAIVSHQYEEALTKIEI